MPARLKYILSALSALIVVALLTVAPGRANAAAAFPDVLHACNTRLCDSTGAVIPRMNGFSIQDGGPWSQATIDSISAEGGDFLRMVVFWDKLQAGNCSSLSASGAAAYLSDLRAQALEAANDGIYSYLELHLNTHRIPSCANTGSGDFTRYMNSGQWITNYLANYFGNPSSSTYVKSIVGFGLNEPPPPDGQANATDVNTQMEQDQSTMITWFRGSGGTGGPAPQWIGFVAYPYASSTPIFNDAFVGQNNQCSNCADANPNAYDAVGGNVVLDLHDYLLGCESSWQTSTGFPMADCDGRQHNGEPYTTSNGGWALHTAAGGAYPCCGLTRTTSQSEFTAFMKPYKDFAKQAQWPLMIGESGWAPPVDTSGQVNWANDKAASWADNLSGPKAAIRLEWDYNTSQSNDQFAADPGVGAPGADTNGWLKFTNTVFAHAF